MSSPSATKGAPVASKKRIRAVEGAHLTIFDVLPGWLVKDAQSLIQKRTRVPTIKLTSLWRDEVISLELGGTPKDYEYRQQPGALGNRGILAPVAADGLHYYCTPIHTVKTVFGPKKPEKAYLVPFHPRHPEVNEADAAAKAGPAKAEQRVPLSPSRFNRPADEDPKTPSPRHGVKLLFDESHALTSPRKQAAHTPHRH